MYVRDFFFTAVSMIDFLSFHRFRVIFFFTLLCLAIVGLVRLLVCNTQQRGLRLVPEGLRTSPVRRNRTSDLGARGNFS